MNWKHAIFFEDGPINVLVLDSGLGHTFENIALTKW